MEVVVISSDKCNKLALALDQNLNEPLKFEKTHGIDVRDVAAVALLPDSDPGPMHFSILHLSFRVTLDAVLTATVTAITSRYPSVTLGERRLLPL
jgi:hypothetical protein